ncbi:hypothetical protein CR194_07415 [Salipaludibacillus keqinensis]|uniref:Uncharacterized protein n=1 Tax=Salipaludibacillus keqinensis TaxID=2045207 RepID=A0A323TD78_9BACI|nr:hypothetical protein [Salipaludibacillus keqinensis]PYZ93019.1 hypothetical protein CR194_07415 [Salipaludibacillus keqinensis]
MIRRINKATYGRHAETVVIPFGLTYKPIKKLAIINFEKNTDSIYKGLELQYLDGEESGSGYRVIAYRIDGYVDVYDDINLNDTDNETFDVAGKGLMERRTIEMTDTIFQTIEGCVEISFSFIDISGRTVSVRITERSKKKTKGMNLLAPIGSSTETPSYFPLFFLFDFDFIRKNKTEAHITIDHQRIVQDPFPLPFAKDFQKRYYSRYTMDCHIVEFANEHNGVLKQFVLDSSGVISNGSLDYQYSKGVLQSISLTNSSHPLMVEFVGGFPDIRKFEENTSYEDAFTITTDESMGNLSGIYSIKREGDSVTIDLTPSDGWMARPNSLLTKAIFRNKSVFSSWPKTYKYHQVVDLKTLRSVSQWERI